MQKIPSEMPLPRATAVNLWYFPHLAIFYDVCEHIFVHAFYVLYAAGMLWAERLAQGDAWNHQWDG
jgi:hypothetical protein